MSFWSHGKLKKICGKLEKAYFSVETRKQTPYSRPSYLTQGVYAVSHIFPSLSRVGEKGEIELKIFL